MTKEEMGENDIYSLLDASVFPTIKQSARPVVNVTLINTA